MGMNPPFKARGGGNRWKIFAELVVAKISVYNEWQVVHCIAKISRGE